MTGTRCDCCDLPASSCGKAAEQRQHAEQAAHHRGLLADPRWMPAQYPGTCAGCLVRFTPGTPITLNRATSGFMWRAACCGVNG